MIKPYFKQAFHLLKENKLLSSISIVGTVLAIAMIMVTVITLRAIITPLAPESYHDRMLIFRYTGFQHKANENWQSNRPISYKTAKACFRETAALEAVTVADGFSETTLTAKLAGEKAGCSVLQVNDDFWKVFRSDFPSGYPFDKATLDASVTKTAISEGMTRQLFGASGIIGKTFPLSHSAYMICGAVCPVSKPARYAYAQIWIPLSSTDAFTTSWGEYGIIGMVSVYILAKSQGDFPATCMEAERLRDRYMEDYPDYGLLYRGQPDTCFMAAQRYSANNPLAVKQAIRQYVITLIILSIVPAVNLSGLILSRMCKRLFKVGVRKTFGTPRRELMIQVLSENMLYLLLGGMLGLILSYGATFSLGGIPFSIDFMGSGVTDLRTMCMDLLFDSAIFSLAFSACFALNLLGAAIPTWRVTRINIVDAINER